ncbi:type II secretion system F family protein [Absiella sp. AM29-15]|uniref:type II secretion system F family protein n=2 Tax=unclassified Amedibacterium TaxID=3088137 RepID=UPI000E40C4E4|nr:type II secretion system F family protein [Absiella sp. AM29-15]RGC51941.1 type II secretion system F family protein [Absiella sp. AM29-15]
MAKYQYTAKDMNSKRVKGKIEANDQQELVTLLRNQNQYLMTCKDITEKEKNDKKLNLKELSEFSRQIGTMLGSGVSLIRAMSILVQREENVKMKKIYKDMYVKLQQGFTLSTAMQDEGRAFPELMVNMYRSGENSGHMDQVAMTMAKQYDKDYKVQSKIKNAMIYPIILVVVMLGCAVLLFTVIIPNFVGVFGNAELPFITLAMMAVSDVMTEYWYWIMIGILVIVAIIASLLRMPTVRFKFDKMKLKLPVFGKLNRTIYTARFARTMCSLYTSGISIINGLMIVRSTIGNKFIEDQFDMVITSVRNGVSLSQSIQKVEGFDVKLASSIYIGEESGRLDEMLTTLADDFDYDSEMASQRMVTVIEPIMIVVMAIMVVIVMMAVLLPVVQLYNDPSAIG